VRDAVPLRIRDRTGTRKIAHPFRPHDLRHTFGCRLASSSVGLQIIAKALGHTSTRMAERFARPSEEAMRMIAAALDADPLHAAGR